VKTLTALVALATIAATAPAASAAGLFGKKQDPLADPAYQATYLESRDDEPAPANGAIFQAQAGYSPLVNGGRAASVGDILTIQLAENTSASKSNSANTGRSGSVGITPPTTGWFSLFSPTSAASSGNQGFKGAGDAAQSNALNGEITVTVARVMRNGMLLVRGQKALTLNRGDEYVQISGLVRPADIGPDNRVLSTRVADARITYTGRGEIARASRQGWLQRFFSMVSPF
jgi:flagellar L-ring protein precursor FlgH